MIELLFLIAAAIPFAWNYYHAHSRKARIRERIPHAMLEAASARGPREILERSSQEKNELAQEFRKVLEKSDRMSLKQALLAYRGEESLERFFASLALWEESGLAYAQAFRNAARSALALRSVEERASAAALTHKYTLLAGGALVIPFTLGMMVNAASAAGAPAGTKAAVLFGVQAYVLFYAVIASYFSSMLEARSERFLAYLLALAACSAVVFSYAVGK